MAYSFEATGIDVSKFDAHFQKPLLWYRPHYLPEYTSVVCGLSTSITISAEGLQAKYVIITTS
jgi:hypothetical protein